jgi:drug/metabolite transporter (DMT)-like permease
MERFTAFGAVIFAVTMWGFVPVWSRILLADLPPPTVLVLRVGLAGILGATIAVIVGVRRIPWRGWMRIAIATVAGNGGYQVLSLYGMQTTPAIWTGMLFGLEPVFIALFAVLLAGERLTLALALGILVAFAGTAVLVIGSASGGQQDATLAGVLLVAASTMGWGIYTVVLRPVAREYGSFVVTCLTLGISALPAFLFLAPEFPAAVAAMTLKQWLVVGSMVVLATLGATAAWNYGSIRIKSSLAGVFLYGQPLIAGAAGIAILGERFTASLAAGGALIIAGVAIAQFQGAPKSAMPRE